MATRIYFPSTGTAAISPAYDSGWEVTSIAACLPAYIEKKNTTMTTVLYDDVDSTNQDILFRQWVSDPLAAQTITAQTVKLQIGASETVGGNNLFVAWTVRVVSDGGTVRGTCIGSPRRDATELAVATLTNRGDLLTSTAVVAQEGDRLVIEIGVGGDPSLSNPHDSSLRIGDNDATDLPEDDTTTADNNPWIEFANNLLFFTRKSSTAAIVRQAVMRAATR